MLRRQRLNLVRLAIVGFWLVMVGLLIWREAGVESTVPAREGGREFETWMGVYAGQETEANRIGFVRTSSAVTEREGEMGNQLGLTVKLAGTMLSTPTEVVITGSAWSPHGEGLDAFEFDVQSFGHTMTAKGKIRDGVLQVNVETAGESYPVSVPVGEDVLLTGSMGTTNMNLPPLEVGDAVTIDTFDPLTLSAGKARVECVDTETLEIEGEPVATRVMTTTVSNVTTKVWVAGDGEVVRIETPFGFVLSRISEEEALSGLDSTGTSQFIESMAVRPSGKTPFRGAERMVIRVDGLPPTGALPDDTLQRVEGAKRITIVRAEKPGGTAHPASSEHLGADPFVQTDHPAIQEKAAELVEGVPAGWPRAQRIYEWVYDTVEKTVVLSFPSALDVLNTREGDCNEHTVLFTALARAAGLPTRIAVGVVWSEELAGFYYHAWPEVHLGRWIPMDPTLGQPIADATHIKLLNGSIEAWPKLVPYLGQLEVEVLEVE